MRIINKLLRFMYQSSYPVNVMIMNVGNLYISFFKFHFILEIECTNDSHDMFLMLQCMHKELS